ncbi:MAG: hypothetical protein ABIT71_18785 [Vicinamibacteraceae bacterium]
MPPTETRAFAHRVRLNLDAIDAVVSVAPAKAHQVTQLVLTLIGLIVLPRESHYLAAAGHQTLPALCAEGWPAWIIAHDSSRRPDGAPDTLGDLLWHLKSTITSGQIRMTAGDPPFKDVAVYFDQQVAGGGIATWSASIPAPDLRVFCVKLAGLIAGPD